MRGFQGSLATLVVFLFISFLSLSVLAADVDRDGLPDDWELSNSRDPAVPDYLVGTGWNTTCGRDDAGNSCFGSTGAGQNNVPSLTDVKQFTTGSNHACALDSVGVHCWGTNFDGRSTPPAMTGVTQISSFNTHTCAVHDAGVSCWGTNGDGQTNVPALTNPTMVTVGGKHTCALDDTGVVCWGLNGNGQTTVPALTNPWFIEAGDTNNCAIDDSGVVCWGNNNSFRSTPPALSNPFWVSLGQAYGCALDDTGVVCWGADNQGQISGVPSVSNPLYITSGVQHSCVLDDFGFRCWGRDVEGQSNTAGLSFDPDGDGLSGVNDGCPLDTDTTPTDSDGDGIPDVCDGHNDSDNDGMSDAWEIQYGLDPFDNSDAVLDSDEDGGSNLHEYLQGTNPIVYDTDGDGSSDYEEFLAGTDPQDDGNRPFWRKVYFGQSENSGFGTSVSGLGDINGDGYDDFAIGAPNENDYAGVVKVVDGFTGSIVYSIDGDASGDRFGYSVSGAGDVNADGYTDVIVGAYGHGGNYTGMARVFSGIDGSTLKTFIGHTYSLKFGEAVSGVGDVNNDGYDDVIVGSPGEDVNGYNSGGARIYSGADWAELHVLHGFGTSTSFGVIVSGAEDVNLDGYDDFLVGASSPSGGREGVTVFSGIDGVILYEIEHALHVSVDNAADINSDGYPDIVMGALSTNVNGENSGLMRSYSGYDQQILFETYGDVAFDRLGVSVSALGDMDSDGYLDVIVGADQCPNLVSGCGSGYIRIVSGFSGEVIYHFSGGELEEEFGSSVSGVGDMDGDGYPDFVVGAKLNDYNGLNSGKVISFLSSDIFNDNDLDYFVNHADPDDDNDGLTDEDEISTYLTNPLKVDTDNDGFSDYDEVITFLTDPLNADGDNDLDGEPDSYDVDDDNDGLIDSDEILIHLTNPMLSDTDADGFSDYSEIVDFGTDPLIADGDNDLDGEPDVFDVDDDNDGLLDTDEISIYFTDPFLSDTDVDGFSDYDEIVTFLTDPLTADGDNDSDGQPDAYDDDDDNDGLSDVDEVEVYFTDPFFPDTDSDGIDDLDEVVLHMTNPVSSDTDGDSISDFDEIFTYSTDPLVADSNNDNDGIPDQFDTDDDNDGFLDGSDPFPLNSSLPDVSAYELHVFTSPNYGDYFGASLALTEDINNDGYADVMVGANGYFPSGRVEAISGFDGVSIFETFGDVDGNNFGVSLDTIDVNQDGYSDLIVGDPEWLSGNGFVKVISGVDQSQLYGQSGLDHAGEVVTNLGDVNGDGYEDFGYIYAKHDSPTQVKVVSGLDYSEIYTKSTTGGYSYSVAAAGDVDVDGYDDFVVQVESVASIYSGLGGELIFSVPDVFRIGWYGNAVKHVGDINLDGYADIATISSDRENLIIHSGLNASSIWTFSKGNNLSAIATAGDVDGDGYMDIVLGSSYELTAQGNLGKARILSGRDGSIFYTFDADYAPNGMDFGAAVDGGYDVNGDGIPDQVIGSTPGDYGVVKVVTVLVDSDGDTVLDVNDLFPYDPTETTDVDSDGIGDNADPDDDNDGMPDTWENTYGLNQLVDDAADDPDGDGFSNLDEYLNGTDPTVYTSDQVAKNDTDGDLDSDIIWRNVNNGAMTIWSVDNKTKAGSFVIGGLGVDYDLIDTNDLDADGDSDLVLFDSGQGRAISWEIENHAKMSGALLATFAGYTIRGLGDVDSDGDADIIWQAESWGGVIVWIMENGAKQSGNFIGTLGDGSEVVAIGDFDNDADADLMWTVPGSNTLVRWDMENGGKVSGTAVGGFAGYSVVDVGDYNNDGTDDLLWEPDGGGSSSIAWLMLNGDKDSGLAVGTLPNYSIASTGDYDGDGDDDILWVNPVNGHAIIWELENGVKVSGNAVDFMDAQHQVRP